MCLILKTAVMSLVLSGCAFAHNEQGQHEPAKKEAAKKPAPKNYAEHQAAKVFIDEMVAEGFDRAYLEETFTNAKRQNSILKAISKPAERRLTWGEYRKIFLGKKRIKQGVGFWQEHEATIKKASQQFKVPEEIIVAIIGVETRYGRHAGNYRVVDALATLAFDYPPRSKFFRGQLKELFKLTKEEQLPIGKLKGSYAGAMGYGQFIPSSYRHYAVDFDGDKKRDILFNPTDAIGSVANYFARHGWTENKPVTQQVKLAKPVDEKLMNAKLKPLKSLQEWSDLGVNIPKEWQQNLAQKATLMKMVKGEKVEYWLGLKNFYVITRYNHSRLYAMAVYQLSQQIVAAKQQAQPSQTQQAKAAL